MTAKTSSKLMCPSADVDLAASAIFGIVIGTPEAPNLVYLDRVKPSEIFRIAATCVERGCRHFDGVNCRLVERIVDRLPVVVETIPDCAIRDRCRWWNQERKAACLRCSQIVHDNYVSSDDLILEVADP